MAKNSVFEYSSTAASNTDVGGVDIQGSAAASNIDDAIRELMSHLADGTLGSISINSTTAGAAIGPTIDIYRNITGADANIMGGVLFSGKDDGGNKTEFARIQASINDASDTTEDGTLSFYIMKAGTSEVIMTLNPNTVTVTPATGSVLALFNTSADENGIILQGGNTASQGAQIFVYGDAHASNANDIRFVSANVLKYIYDASAAQHQFTDGVMNGTFSLTGATAGTTILAGLITSSGTGTGATTHQAYYNANGNVGGISTSGTTTTFATSSDQRLKKNFRAPEKQGSRIDSVVIHEYDWKGGGVGIGPKAQEIAEIFPEAVVPGKGEPGEPGFVPWQWDASKLVPSLVLEIQDLRRRVAALELTPR